MIQGSALGNRYRPGRQSFGVTLGQEYIVFSLYMLDGNLWVEITDIDLQPGYLAHVPIVLFEIVDARVSRHWEFRIGNGQDFRLAPPSLFEKYFHDDLFEQREEAVREFLRLKRDLYAESERTLQDDSG